MHCTVVHLSRWVVRKSVQKPARLAIIRRSHGASSCDAGPLLHHKTDVMGVVGTDHLACLPDRAWLFTSRRSISQHHYRTPPRFSIHHGEHRRQREHRRWFACEPETKSICNIANKGHAQGAQQEHRPWGSWRVGSARVEGKQWQSQEVRLYSRCQVDPRLQR
jgi:hypothetical protein